MGFRTLKYNLNYVTHPLTNFNPNFHKKMHAKEIKSKGVYLILIEVQ